MTTNLTSPWEWPSSFSARYGSSKTSAASSKLTPCLRRLAAAFLSSHSNLTRLSAAFRKLFGFDVGGRRLEYSRKEFESLLSRAEGRSVIRRGGCGQSRGRRRWATCGRLGRAP